MHGTHRKGSSQQERGGLKADSETKRRGDRITERGRRSEPSFHGGLTFSSRDGVGGMPTTQTEREKEEQEEEEEGERERGGEREGERERERKGRESGGNLSWSLK